MISSMLIQSLEIKSQSHLFTYCRVTFVKLGRNRKQIYKDNHASAPTLNEINTILLKNTIHKLYVS